MKWDPASGKCQQCGEDLDDIYQVLCDACYDEDDGEEEEWDADVCEHGIGFDEICTDCEPDAFKDGEP